MRSMISLTSAVVAVAPELVKLIVSTPLATEKVATVRPPTWMLEPLMLNEAPLVLKPNVVGRVGRAALHREAGAGVVAIAAVAGVELDVGNDQRAQQGGRRLLGGGPPSWPEAGTAGASFTAVMLVDRVTVSSL